MGSFSDIRFRLRSPKESLLFFLGLVSTWQILQVAGVALSTWVTLLTAGYLLLTQGFHFRKDWLLLAMLASVGLTLVVSMVSNIPGGYKRVSLINTIQWGLIFIVLVYVRREETSKASSAFMRGFDWSCKIQLAWCVLQIICKALGNVNLNHLVFGQLLHLSDDPNLYLNQMICGLHWHVANLTPILVFLYFRYSNFLFKACCLGVAVLTGSATPMVAAALCVFFDVLRFCKHTLWDRHCAVAYKVVVFILLGFFGLLLVSPILLPKVWDMLEYLLLRLYQINNPTVGHESSAVHFNYYRFLPDVLRSIPLREAVFGSGMATSGYRFTVLISQFPDAIWSVESDPVNLILSQGLLGAAIHYGFLGCLIRNLLRAKQGGRACFLLVLLICGFAYNNQFIWVQLLQFMMYCQVQGREQNLTKEP